MNNIGTYIQLAGRLQTQADTHIATNRPNKAVLLRQAAEAINTLLSTIGKLENTVQELEEKIVLGQWITTAELRKVFILKAPFHLITPEELKRLRDDQRFLASLQMAGVGNWDGYDYALNLLEDWSKENGEASQQLSSKS